MWVKQYKDSKESINLNNFLYFRCSGIPPAIDFFTAREYCLSWRYETEKQRDQAFLYLCGIANVEIIGDK